MSIGIKRANLRKPRRLVAGFLDSCETASLAKRMFDLGIERVSLRSGVKEEHILDFAERMHDPDLSIRDFSRPNIEIGFRQPAQSKPSPTPLPEPIRPPICVPEVKFSEPPAGNPFAGKSLQFIYAACSDFRNTAFRDWAKDPDKRKQFGHLVGWLDYLLQDQGSNIARVYSGIFFSVSLEEPKVREALIKELTGIRELFAYYESQIQAISPQPKAEDPVPSPGPALAKIGERPALLPVAAAPQPHPDSQPRPKPAILLLDKGHRLNRWILRQGSSPQIEEEAKSWLRQSREAVQGYKAELQRRGRWTDVLLFQRQDYCELCRLIEKLGQRLNEEAEKLTIPPVDTSIIDEDIPPYTQDLVAFHLLCQRLAQKPSKINTRVRDRLGTIVKNGSWTAEFPDFSELPEHLINKYQADFERLYSDLGGR